jgi:hypothetical protein
MSLDDSYCRLADLQEALKGSVEPQTANLLMQIAELEDTIACEEHDAEMDGDKE